VAFPECVEEARIAASFLLGITRPSAIPGFTPRPDRQKKQSPEGSRLRGFYFRLHPLMPGKRNRENTNGESVIHYCDRGIVFDEQEAVEETKKSMLMQLLLADRCLSQRAVDDQVQQFVCDSNR
jgi:hypothetical protein